MQASALAKRSGQEPTRTALYELHVELGARLVPFAGFYLPLNYPAGILAEHRHTRSHASLFDVSHMNRIRVAGVQATAALESLCPADLAGLPPDRLRYSLFTNDDGGIVDDFMIRRHDNGFEIIANAATRDTVNNWLADRIGDRCKIAANGEFALLALQGPRAAEVLATLQPNIQQLSFMQAATLELSEKFCLVARCGYTGEDGFEISVPAEHTVTLARQLLEHEAVSPAGLGARDGLRLEAGLPLSGQDLDATTSPVEAGLAWTISRVRSAGGERAGGFPGSERILAELERGPARHMTGLLPGGRALLRTDTRLYDNSDRTVGRVTSGAYSPVLERPIALGYLDRSVREQAGTLRADLRGRSLYVATTELPFVPHRYVRIQTNSGRT